MAKSLQDRIKAKQQKKFVGRDQHVKLFEHNLSSDDPMILFNIFGQGGVGKTYLSRQYKEIADKNNCLTAYSDETTISVLHWMEQVSKQFNEQKAELSNFDELYKKYQQETKHLEADPNKPKNIVGNLVKDFTKGAINEAKKIPGVGIIEGFIDFDNVANVAGDWAGYVAQKITNKDEVELILQPEKVLSPLFWKDVSKFANKKTAICFFIDTFEESYSILETWLLECLEEKHGEIPANSQFVIAGRDELNPNRWSAYYDVTQTISLEPFTDTEMELFFAHHSIVDDAMKADIRRLTNGLPVLMAWLCEAAKTGKGTLQDAADTAVERFLKWVVDEKQRAIALEAALARRINQDIIECLLLDAGESKAYFDWLIKQPFTLKRGDAWAYHNVVREQMMRFIRTKSPKQWTACHEKLSTYYQKLQNDLELKEEDTFLHDKWLAYEAERLYHALCAKPDKNIAQVIENFVTLLDNSDLNKRVIFGEILKEAGESTEHNLCKGWGLQIMAAIDETDNENHIPLQQLCEDILTKCLVLKNDNRAFLYYFIGSINNGIQKDYEKAIEQFQKAIEIKPDFTDVYLELGQLYQFVKQNYDLTIELYQKLIKIKPDNAWVYYFLGQIFRYNKQEYDLAIEHYQKLIEIKPDYAYAYFELGQIYQYDKLNYDLAIEQYQKTIEIKPDDAYAYFELGQIYQYDKLNYDLAIEYYQKAIEIKPDYPNAYFQLGQIYNYNKQDYDLAIKHYQKEIETNPDYVDAYLQLGYVYSNYKLEYDLAIEHYQKLIEIKPDDAYAYLELGQIYQYDKLNYDLAIEYYQKVIEIKPNDAEAYDNLGDTFSKLKDYCKAIENYQKATEIKPENNSYVGSLGFALLQNGQLDEAEEILIKAIVLGNLKYSNMNLGHVHFVKGMQQEAMACYFKSFTAFEDKDEFWAGIADDFQYLEQYGINAAQYEALLTEIKANIEKE